MDFNVNEFFNKVYEKQEQILSDIAEIKITLAKQHENLQFHMYRTSLNEEQIKELRQHQDDVIEKLENSLKEVIEKLDNRIKPIEKHVNYLDGALKLFGVLSIVSGALFGIYKLLSLF